MKLSQFATHTTRDAPAEEESINAQLLNRGGFVRRLTAGVYSYLPLGTRVLHKIENIIRREMDAVDSQEIFMAALHPADPWKQTGRWEEAHEILFKMKGAGDRDFTLGPTHEEIVTPLIGEFIRSYRDLPKSVYQIQTKYRNEKRAKSGVLRGREFRMKDMYSFHATEDDLDAYYERSKGAYEAVFKACGLGDITYETFASGGMFSKYSHEYQTITESGEDTIYICEKCRKAYNREIIEDIKHACVGCGDKNLIEKKAIEVGNIFKLMTRFSDAFALKFSGQDGKMADKVYMGCYGIGSTRLIGTIVEASHDDNGIIWPETVAPYRVGVINLNVSDDTSTTMANDIYAKLSAKGTEVIYDDRDERAGAKHADMDLIGIPWQIIVGPRDAKNGTVEVKNRKTGEKTSLSVDAALAKVTQ
jgi:prolyl-tRNA synthetase